MLSRAVRDQVALALTGLALERVVDDLELQDDRGIVVRGRLKCGDDLLCLGVVTLRNEPTRRLGQEGDESDKRYGENALERDGDTPRGRVVEVAARRQTPTASTPSQRPDKE